MSRPRKRWWGYARRAVRDYPQLQKEWESIHMQSITANISGMPRGGSVSRTTEIIALRQMDPDNQRDYDAVTMAIEQTRLMPNGEEHLRLIKHMYWQERPGKILDAAAKIHIEEATAKRWHGQFIRLVGENLWRKDDTGKPK